jgi:hypothetical protein
VSTLGRDLAKLIFGKVGEVGHCEVGKVKVVVGIEIRLGM